MHWSLLPVTLAAAGLVAVQAQEPPARPLTLETLRAQRRELAFRQRGLIMNNDGCDVLYYPKDREVTAQGLLEQRTAALAGTQVGAIAYCTISSGFSFFTHDTKAGTVLDRQPADYGLQPQARNVARELIAQGADCLKLVVDYAHAHGMEAFWSMRMNDTHDVEHRPEKPYLLYPPLKEQHPEWLVGEVARRTPCGRWSSVNYGVPEVRDLAFRFVEEVCRNYDVDGIELDFFRHLCFFPSTANGGSATDQERGQMTELLRRIRAMTEEAGLARGRPILVAVRVPDSVPFCRELGLDLERWLAEGLADILITTCYFRLNPWQVSVELGHRYGVAVYPCLSDSRVQGETRFRRSSLEAYRGRAVNAWHAGADGLHLFNYFNPKAALWSELGSPETLRGKDKLFFVTVRDGNPEAWLAGGRRHAALPMLTPGTPLPLQPGAGAEVMLEAAEDIPAARAAGLDPRTVLHLRVGGLTDPARLAVVLNGRALAGAVPAAGGWVDVPVPPEALAAGPNRVSLALSPAPAAPGAEEAWNPSFGPGAPPGEDWRKDTPATRCVVELRDGALLIADRGTAGGDYCYFRHPLAFSASGEVVLEARLKVLSGVSSLIFGNGATGQRLSFFPDRVEFYHDPAVRVPLDTTDGFHTYRLVIRGEDVSLSIDGRPRLEGKGCFRPGRAGYRSEVAFGAANSPEVGEALWEFVRARSDAVTVSDLVLSVRYPAGR